MRKGGTVAAFDKGEKEAKVRVTPRTGFYLNQVGA